MDIRHYIPIRYIIAGALRFGVTDTEDGTIYPFSTRETAIDAAKHMNVGRTGFESLTPLALRLVSNLEAIR
jgi:hypothetical protein